MKPTTARRRVRKNPSVALRPYLPATLLESASRHGSPTWWEWLDGSMMHCDISGFTAMSERLASLGNEGAELMVGVLNRFFETMLEIATGHGAVQMKFGGDAMLLYFGGDGHTHRAAACGLAMQRAMKPFRHVKAGGQEHSLKMRAGIHSGRFFSASAGDPERLLHYVLTGADLRRAAIVEEHTGLGKVGASPEAAALLEGAARLGPATDGVFTVRATNSPPPAPARVDAPMLPQHLSELIREGRTISGEHRRVTAIFINVLGLDGPLLGGDEDGTLALATAFVRELTGTIERHGGYLLGSDVADVGDKFIVLFGAPVARVGQESAAMGFALDLLEGVQRAGLPLRLKTGINTGYVFAGDVGSLARREYTTIGDGMNLAARLMAAAAPGTVMVSRSTAEAAPGFGFRRLRSIRVKGKAAPVGVARLIGRAADGAIAESKLVGRGAEIGRLLRLASAAENGAGHLAHVWGDPGIGKSRLVAELAERLRKRSWRVVTVGCQPQSSGTPFGAWDAVLGSEPVAAAVPAEAERARGLLGPGDQDDDDPRQRREATVLGITNCLRAVAQTGPTLVILEDVHWSDASSLIVLSRLVEDPVPGLIVCATSLQPPADASAQLDLHLQELSLDAATGLARRLMRDSASLAAVVERARGNPLFLTEFARAGADGGTVPDSLNDLVTARIDALQPAERQVLRTAAVAGIRFELPLVQELAAPADAQDTEQIVRRLAEKGFARFETDEGPVYSFTHALLNQVAYDSAPFAWRRRVHARAAALLESEHRGSEQTVSDALLHHFGRAANDRRVVRYAAMSGDRSARVFSNLEAVQYYEQALAALERTGRGGADRSALVERIGDILEVTGRHHDAAEKLTEALELFQASRPARPAFVAGSGPVRTREAVLCRKIAVATEHASDYENALAWLERARAALPRGAGRLRAQVFATTCGVLFRQGRYAEAMDWGRQAVKSARGASDGRREAYAHNMMATALIEAGRLNEAIRHLRKAVKAYHEAGDYAGQASANNNLGSAYQLLGMYDAALYHYEMANIADERAGDDVDAAIVHNNMAETLILLDREDEAIERLQAVLVTARAEPDLADLGGWAHVTTARCYRSTGRLAEAARHLRTGIATLRKVGSLGLLTEAMVDFTEQALAEGDIRLARRRAVTAFRRARDSGSRLAMARAERILGECAFAEGDSAAGQAHLKTAIEGFRRVAAEYEEARTAVILAAHLNDQGKRSDARRLARRAHRVFTRCGATRQAQTATAVLEAA